MIWHAPRSYKSFKHWLTHFAELLGIPRREVCLPAAYSAYCMGFDPHDTHRAWSR